MMTRTTIASVLATALMMAHMVSANDSTKIVPIHGYMPVTDVTHQMALSRDFSLVRHLDKAGGFEAGKKLYEQGGYSESTAKLNLVDALTVNILKGTPLVGTANNGETVIGTLANDQFIGSMVLEFLYPAIGNENEFYPCNVGGLPESHIETSGCLKDHGQVQTTDGQAIVNYKHKNKEDTFNGMTLAQLSSEDNKRMRPGENADKPYFKAFQPFVDYYGTFDYANQIILAGFDSKNTNLERDNFRLNGEADDHDKRRAVIHEGTSILSVGMNVLRELEWSVYQCEECAKMDTPNDCHHPEAAIKAVDEAVAFYHGSDDNFFRQLANQRCSHFGTCSDDGSGDSMVNVNIATYFQQVQSSIQDGNCAAARVATNEITRQMWIPMIQGNLRFAWMLSDDNPHPIITSSGHQAQGAIYAASILPILYECDTKAADVVRRNMQVREEGIVDDFVAVKQALEGCYDYLGITCSDVGGLMDNQLTQPCIDGSSTPTAASSTASSSDKKKRNGGRVFGFIVLFFVLIGMATAAYFFFFSQKKNDKQMTVMDTTSTVTSHEDVPEQPLDQDKPELV